MSGMSTGSTPCSAAKYPLSPSPGATVPATSIGEKPCARSPESSHTTCFAGPPTLSLSMIRTTRGRAGVGESSSIRGRGGDRRTHPPRQDSPSQGERSLHGELAQRSLLEPDHREDQKPRQKLRAIAIGEPDVAEDDAIERAEAGQEKKD